MKLTIQKTENIEVEVQLPTYRRTKFHYFKIDEKETITVYDGGNEFRIEKTERMIDFPLTFDETTPDEFNDKYKEVFEKIVLLSQEL